MNCLILLEYWLKNNRFEKMNNRNKKVNTDMRFNRGS